MKAILIDPWERSLTTIDLIDGNVGRGVVIGYDKAGKERETKLTVDDLSNLISWE